MTLRDRIRVLVEATPTGTLVPVAWLADLLAGEDEEGASSPIAREPEGIDLTVAQLAQRLGRGSSTVRTWCIRGELAGAYRLQGREWRIPAAAVQSFQRAQAQQHRTDRTVNRNDAAVDLGTWRQHMQKGR